MESEKTATVFDPLDELRLAVRTHGRRARFVRLGQITLGVKHDEVVVLEVVRVDGAGIVRHRKLRAHLFKDRPQDLFGKTGLAVLLDGGAVGETDGGAQKKHLLRDRLLGRNRQRRSKGQNHSSKCNTRHHLLSPFAFIE
jgi:hypothetical protein